MAMAGAGAGPPNARAWVRVHGEVRGLVSGKEAPTDPRRTLDLGSLTPPIPSAILSPILTVSASVIFDFVDAILARNLPRACSALHPDIDFRAMTPNRVWEANGPAGVEKVLRAWFEHPERDVEHVDATEPAFVEDTVRVGWRVYGSDNDGPFIYEQQAYLREKDGRVVWLRVICSGPRPVGNVSSA
jgi:hypothetical protein